MKKIAFIPFLMLGCFINADAQSYGSFASGVFLTQNGTFTGYSVSGDPVNQISATPFSGNLGTFQQNSGTLALNGGETKTYKQNWANVCGSTLYYSVHPTGSTGSYEGLNLPYKAGCSGGTFSDGLGNCGGNDQKWSTISYAVDLTTYCPGDYTIDIYYGIPGSNSSTNDCGDKEYLGSAARPAASATFTISGTGPSITGNTTVCPGASTTLTADGCSGGTITWSNGQTGSSISAPAGSYTANCTLNGCTSPASAAAVVTETAVATPTVTAGTTDCPAGTTILTASNYTGDVIWSNGETGTSVTVPAGTYTAHSSYNGCVSSNSSATTVEPCVADCPASGNLLVNGSFQDNHLYRSPDEVWTWQGVIQPGWTDLQPINEGLIETWQVPPSLQVPDGGDQIIELNYLNLGILTQDVNVVPNNPLTLTYYHRAFGAYANELIRVEVEDLTTHQLIDTFTSSVDYNQWYKFETSFTPSNSNIEIRFVSLSTGNGTTDSSRGNLLDNVTLNYSSCTNATMSKTATLPTVATSISASPNPVTDIASLKLSGFASQPVSIQVTNLNGTVINTAKYDYVYGMNIPLDMSSLPVGMYFVKAQQGDKVAVIKMVKR